MQADPADMLCDALQTGYLEANWPTAEAVRHVGAGGAATDSSTRVLVADDTPTAPLLHKHFADVLLRVTVIGVGRTHTRAVAAGCADWIKAPRRVAGMRVRNVSTLAEGRGRSTGNDLVFFTVPAIVRPI